MEYEKLLELIKIVSTSNLTEFCYEEGDVKIHMSSADASAKQVESPIAKEKQKVNHTVVQETVAEQSNHVEPVISETQEPVVAGNIVKSPLVGVFYTAPSEDSAPFVSVGDKVKKGQTLAIVEAMKLMNDIECEFDGEVAEVFVANAEAVEYGQPLFRIV